ncbi:MAG: SWIM zinc finger family protein [Halanaeroarchaeum sp.]
MPEAVHFTRAEARYQYSERYYRGSRYNDRHLQDVQIKTQMANRFVVDYFDSDEAHVVDLAADEGKYVGSCTCGDFEYRETVCKHMWAVLADPSTAVLDRSATQPQRPSLRADGGAVATATTSPTNGRAPDYGDRVEAAVCRRLDLHPVDGEAHDARTTEDTPGDLPVGTPIQIKGAQDKIRNGYDDQGNQTYTSGRLTLWSEPLIDLLIDDGRYVVVTYDEDAEPADPGFITRLRVLRPEQIGDVAEGSWYDRGDRPSKGDVAKVSWPKVLGADPDV